MQRGTHRGGRPRRAEPMTRDKEMWASEALVSDAIGRLIGFWGFNKHLGRIWTVLYLSDEPLSSRDLQGRLDMSSGAVSMALQEMGRWGIVNKVWLEGERREYFVAERDFWKMISRVYRERERAEVLDAIDAMEEAIRFARRKAEGTKDEHERRRAKTQLERIGQLLDLARLGLRFIDMLLDKGRVDASPLLGLFLGESKKSD